MNSQSNQRPVLETCHVCEGARIYYLFSTGEHRVVRCADCGLMFLNPQPSDDELAKSDSADHFAADNANFYFSQLCRYRGPLPGRILEIGGSLSAPAALKDWKIVEKPFLPLGRGTLEFPAAEFDVCSVSHALECVRLPLDFLAEIHRVLKPGGVLFLVVDSIDEDARGIFGRKSPEIKSGQLTHFSSQTLQTILFKAGFCDVIVQHDEVPAGKNSAGRLRVFATRRDKRPREMLSVIVPAFNEAATFSLLMDSLLRKELPNLDIEIVVVESNSTDGTRELALKYKNHPRVKLILEEQPLGKGHAVRAGLKFATGDYVLIQDADLEYDLEDYDALLEELTTGRNAFVLGSRHGGRNVMKMRQFAGQRSLSLFFNTGHWIFTSLINLLFSQRLHDPFTMYKVFRRDCLFGLEFECNRFDFDYELLVKLIRKGYRPVELPVNYRSRSYREGKKVRVFRDPLSWLKVLLWLRWIKIDTMSVAEKNRTAASGPSSIQALAAKKNSEPLIASTP